MDQNFSYPEYIKVLLFEHLLPQMLYTGEGKDDLFNSLRYDGQNLILYLVDELYQEDNQNCPYSTGDFKVEILNRGGIGMMRIDLPQGSEDVCGILRAYILFVGNDDIIAHKKYFIIKRFPNGKVFIIHINLQIEGLLGEELTDNAGDIEYEYWKLAQNYTTIILPDLMNDEQQQNENEQDNGNITKKWSRDWVNFDWKTIEKNFDALDNQEENDNKDIGISNEEFLEYLDWLAENDPCEFERLKLYAALRETGADNDKAIYFLSHTDELAKELRERIHNKQNKDDV